jgi:hypothetical protein
VNIPAGTAERHQRELLVAIAAYIITEKKGEGKYTVRTQASHNRRQQQVS